MYSHSLFFALLGVATALPGSVIFSRNSVWGVATFNDYSSQGSTVCGPLGGVAGTYGAAASDISPDISGGLCYSTINMNNCNGQQPVAGYESPSCPRNNCGKCYRVTNMGGMGGNSVGGVGRHAVVQIIDSCPSVNAWNYCKTNIPANQRCESSTTNQLDIDMNAYEQLTGQPYGSGPNLMIVITPWACP